MANCFHHLNRPAGAACDKCGKGLCSECADLFGTTDGGTYCVECYKAIVGDNVVKLKRARGIILREFIFIIAGLILGLIIGIAAKQDLIGVVLYVAVGGSLGTIIKQTANAHYKGWGWLWVILYFVLMVMVSPIMTVIRIVRRIKDMIRLKKIAQSDADCVLAADQFFRMARNPEAAVENEKGEALNVDALMQQLGQSIQVAHDGSINLDQIIHR